MHYFPSQATTLNAALASSLASIADGQSKTDGIQVGQAVAAQWLALRSGDGLEAPLTYTPGHSPGIWEPVPTYPALPPNTPPAFEDVVTEVDSARVYGGMHYRHSVKQGNRLGRLVTEYVLRHHFKANDE